MTIATTAVRKARTLAKLLRYATANRLSRRVVTDPTGPVVSLTTYGPRVGTVHLAIESIAAGTLRPCRLILWLDEVDVLANPPAALRRLMRRGLEIRATEDYGPHKKYFPYARSIGSHDAPLVTADDDWFYPRAWLKSLVDVSTSPSGGWSSAAHRARRVRIEGGSIAPYARWEVADDSEVTARTIGVGCWGQLLPPAVLDLAREEGEVFMHRAPRADDIWIHMLTLRAGHLVRTAGVLPDDSFVHIPEPRGARPLHDENVAGGGNDVQIAKTYGPAEIAAITGRERHATDPRS